MSDIDLPGAFFCNPSDDQWAEFDGLFDKPLTLDEYLAAGAPDVSELSWDDLRRMCDELSDHIQEWQGVPVPLDEDTPLVLAEGHPLRGLFRRKAIQDGDVNFEIIPDDRWEEHETLFECSGADICEEERVVNEWYSRKTQSRVLVIQRAGRSFCVKIPRSPDRSMDRMDFWLTTIGASDAWDLDAEHRARETLRAMLSERQWRHYDLTGCFMETSPRSRVTYVFRRLRPTIAMSFRGRDGRSQVRCLAVLCLHPIGYYDQTWGGCMVPTDDVIAHLSWMRGDETRYWGAANQHDPASPQAGL